MTAASHPLASAVGAWDRRWSLAEGREAWLEPERTVVETVAARRDLGQVVALDIGCGVGRHALALAQLGCRVTAIDGSAAGLDFARNASATAGLDIDFREGSMLELPVADGTQDYVLAWNVIYHGDADVVQHCIAEIRRVLKPGGIYQGTMLSKRNQRFGRGQEVAHDTFVIPEESDKAHPHYYCNAAELVAMFDGFELLLLVDQEHGQPGSWHWHLVATRL